MWPPSQLLKISINHSFWAKWANILFFSFARWGNPFLWYQTSQCSLCKSNCLAFKWHDLISNPEKVQCFSCLFPAVYAVFCDSYCNALTLLWDLCCGQNDPGRIGKRYWISQLQCPENRRSHISHSTLDTLSLVTIEPYWLGWSHAHPIRQQSTNSTTSFEFIVNITYLCKTTLNLPITLNSK